MFHMKHPQGECSVHTCMGIAEPQDVGLWRSQRPNMRLRVSQNMLAYFMTKYEHVGHEVSKHIYYISTHEKTNPHFLHSRIERLRNQLPRHAPNIFNIQRHK